MVGCCLWGRTESDTTEATQQWQQQQHNWKLTEQDYKLAAAGAGDASRLGGHTWL